MTYTIKTAETQEGVITTTVRYDFDGRVVDVAIPHFQPTALTDITDGILRRAVTEQEKWKAAIRCELFLSQLSLGKVVPL